MTYSFHVDEPAPTRPGSPPRPGEGWTLFGPGGLQVLVALTEPDEAEVDAVERGPIALGVRDTTAESALLVEVGEPQGAGHLSAEAPLAGRPSWWSADVELALCDGEGVVRAVRRFHGPAAEPEPGWGRGG